MKRCFLKILMVVCLTFALWRQAEAANTWIAVNGTTGANALPGVELMASEPAGITVDFNIPGLESVNVEVDGKVYQRLSIPNEGHTEEVGKPEVPFIGSFLEIPWGAEIEVEIVDSNFTVLEGYNVYPAQKPLPDMPLDEAPEFVKDDSAYSQDAFYPANIASAEEPMGLRGHRITLLAVYPVQYNPVRKQLRVYSNIRVKLHYGGVQAQISGIERRFESKEFEALCSALILNYQAPNYQESSGAEIQVTGTEYLIITHNDFYDPDNPNNPVVRLANWKRQKGLDVKIVPLSEIGWKPSADKIFDYYKNWNPLPTYLLLIGDADFIPCHYKTNHPDYIEQEKRIGTDLYYATIDPKFPPGYPEYTPDIFIGRLPVRSLAEADRVITKILDYEKGSGGSPDWLTKALIVWSTERSEWRETSKKIIDFLGGLSYNLKCVEVSSGSKDAHTQKVIDYINEGCVIITHRDHGNSMNGPYGDYDGWGDPRFTTYHVTKLTNNQKLPVMFSINCRTGWFDGETDEDSHDVFAPTGGTDCLGEALLKRQGGGVVGFIGSTRISYTGYNDELCKGFYDCIWPDFTPDYTNYIGQSKKLGKMLLFGKMHMYKKHVGNTYKKVEFEEFHLLGDPEMSIRGVDCSYAYGGNNQKYYEFEKRGWGWKEA